MASAHITVKADLSKIQGKLNITLNDSRLKLMVHNLLAKMCDPYVPFDSGTLAQTAQVSHESVRYSQPYARYQYYGEVYGPNIPITENGMIVGWFSPKGQKKHPTGRPINYSKSGHPLATSKWDEAMMRDRGQEFLEQVKQLITQRLKEMYG